jgi:NADPH-dependent 2,4-dienoyl-CoA reductase/sulfur reductase-like enzyme
MSRGCDVAIVGAGPYALSTATFLRGMGVDVRIFGTPMGFWESMPAGMFLRSYRSASSVADPDRSLSLENYEAAVGRNLASPVPLQDFIAYGRWFQERAVPDVDPRHVALVSRNGDGFRLVLDDGEPLSAQRVVVATGIGPFAWWPPEFSGLDRDLVSHTSEHRRFDQFRGISVLVIGGGQSALESAALLHEVGADVEVLVRARTIQFLRGERLYANAGILRDVLYPPHGVGPPGLNVVMGTPALYRILPRALSTPLAQRSIRPAAAAWLRPRLAEVKITKGHSVASIARTDGRVRLRLDSGVEKTVEHVLLGTGYRVDVRRYAFLDPTLAIALRTVDGYPVLTRAFESSVTGLHFLGAAAAASAGPGLRFVSHTGPAAAAIRQRVLRGSIRK